MGSSSGLGSREIDRNRAVFGGLSRVFPVILGVKSKKGLFFSEKTGIVIDNLRVAQLFS